MMRVEVVSNEVGCNAFLEAVEIPWRWVLFGGDRILNVTHFIMYRGVKDGSILGIASLSPIKDGGSWSREEDHIPEIIGLWIAPGHRNKGLGTRLLKESVELATIVYGTNPVVTPVTSIGDRIVEKLKEGGVL